MNLELNPNKLSELPGIHPSVAKVWHEGHNIPRLVALEPDDVPKERRLAPEELAEDIHRYHLRDLEDAYDYRTEREDMFLLVRRDNEIEDVICAALKFAIEEVNKPYATVSGLVVGVISTMLNNHRALSRYLDAPQRPYPRAIRDIWYDIERERFNSSINLKFELEQALDLEEAATGVRRDATEVIDKLRVAHDLSYKRLTHAENQLDAGE